MRNLILILLWVGLVACSQTPQPAEQPETNAVATLLARLETGDHVVEFYEFAPGQIAIAEEGIVGEAEPLALDLETTPVLEVYRTLRPEGPVPEALQAALDRKAAGEHRLAKAPLEDKATETALETQTYDTDATWFKRHFCSSQQVDVVFCPTSRTWASSGWRKTMFFQTTAMAASHSASARVKVETWNCQGGCGWKVYAHTTLAPRHWRRWTFQSNGWFRSRVDGLHPDKRIHFALRYRHAPSGFTYLGNYPKEKTTAFSEELQGVTHNYSNWFISNRDSIYRIPVSRDLNRGASAATDSVGTPSVLRNIGVNHYGDMDYRAGRLYVALEGSNPAAIGVFDFNLNYVDHAFLPSGVTTAAWVAINPKDGLLYTSKTFSTSRLQKYRIRWSGSNLSLIPAGELILRNGSGQPVTIARVQGGDFSASGKLYLVSDKEGHGIKVVDSVNGRVQAAINVAFKPGFNTYEELEGITLWDLDDGRAPGIRGQIHLLMLDNDWPDSDDWYFKHFRVSDKSKL